MSKVFLLVSALLLGGAAFGLSSQRVLAAGAENAAAARKACEQEAMRRHYTGKQRSRFIRQCLAKKDRKPDEEEIVLPDRDPFSPPVVPRLTPSRRVGPAGTLPSNAPVVPSTPVIGSSGTSTSGSSATSTSGSSGTSIGGSRR
jgi:hypothetical protein